MTDRAAAWAAGLALIFAAGCGKPAPGGNPPPAKSPPAATPSPPPAPAPPLPSLFRAEAAMEHARRLVMLGPRHPGSAAAEQARAYCSEQLRAAGWAVADQAFDAVTPTGNATFVNLVARFPSQPGRLPATDQALLLGAHYDTANASSGSTPGANDGASGPAVVIEAATALARKPSLAKQVELVLFDGREPVRQFGPEDGLYGSRFHAAQRAGSQPAFTLAVLLGMVGAREGAFTLTPETSSDLVRRVHEAASAETGDRVVAASRPAWDDHVPFVHAGVRTLLLTDAAYPFVRTADDTLERLDPDALARTGRLVLRLLEEPEAAPGGENR